MVPLVGFELTTYRLQGGCSTPELKRLINKMCCGCLLPNLLHIVFIKRLLL
jgi:hypothetical protein